MARVKAWQLPPLEGETAEQLQYRRDRAYFDQTMQRDNIEWLRRMGALDFEGKSVLEIGCGHGALSVMAARQGATRVLGIDLDTIRIQFAQRNLQAEYPELTERVGFQEIDIAKLSGQFDLVISKDTFEHVDDLGGMLADVWRLLAPNGILAAGFSPLYYSPFGDHGRFHLPLPWLHALLPEPMLFRWLQVRKGISARSASDLGLNKLTSTRFVALLHGQRWADLELKFNRGGNLPMKLFTLVRRLPMMEKFVTVGIYMTARKPG